MRHTIGQFDEIDELLTQINIGSEKTMHVSGIAGDVAVIQVRRVR